MLKSCVYCGDIHDRKYVCDKKPNKQKVISKADKFRWTKAWQNKRKYIRDRDRHMCQVCLRELYNTQQRYNYTNIQVHHVVPLVEDFSKRLDDSNLISVCTYHHSMAERGEISREELFNIK
ncbi:HNH endonuclease [Metabacillus elymi]|uniref:Putative HNH nuclease YajD n=3 Tax=Metabacillus TaxID=2675233 RepID=A0A179SUM8_9BACI|nr:HNH endonuclease [Metabacillus sp. KUDC1714]OAS85221.1 hypothetical protein A6K24_06860 [Metabacillus litoralis]QNF26114.1 HNH endonuclease [Metabacillus sp. KUDC1714]